MALERATEDWQISNRLTVISSFFALSPQVAVGRNWPILQAQGTNLTQPLSSLGPTRLHDITFPRHKESQKNATKRPEKSREMHQNGTHWAVSQLVVQSTTLKPIFKSKILYKNMKMRMEIALYQSKKEIHTVAAIASPRTSIQSLDYYQKLRY